MKILAVDSSSKIYSAALFEGNQRLTDLFSNSPSGDAKSESADASHHLKKESLRLRPDATSSLFRLIQQLIERQGWSISQIEGLAVAQGPGLFTGLRVGVVAAKMLAYSLEIPLVAVNTLDAIAWQTAKIVPSPQSYSGLQVLIGAQRKQWFVREYRWPDPFFELSQQHEKNWYDSMIQSEAATKIVTIEQFTQQLPPNSLISGSGLHELKTQGVQLPGIWAPQPVWNCTATSIGQLAWLKFRAGELADIWSLEPLYYRPSYAEEN